MLKLRSQTKQCLEKQQVSGQVGDADPTLNDNNDQSPKMSPFCHIY